MNRKGRILEMFPGKMPGPTDSTARSKAIERNILCFSMVENLEEFMHHDRQGRGAYPVLHSNNTTKIENKFKQATENTQHIKL